MAKRATEDANSIRLKRELVSHDQALRVATLHSDRATNIAEDVIFVACAKDVRHAAEGKSLDLAEPEAERPLRRIPLALPAGSQHN